MVIPAFKPKLPASQNSPARIPPASNLVTPTELPPGLRTLKSPTPFPSPVSRPSTVIPPAALIFTIPEYPPASNFTIPERPPEKNNKSVSKPGN